MTEDNLKVIDRRHEMTPFDDEVEPVENSPADLMRVALMHGESLEKIEKMLGLQQKWELNEARKAYHKAMAAFKRNPPKIEKTKEVSFGQNKASYWHADLADSAEKINMALSPHGLHATWKTEQKDLITVTCTITHELGHSESTALSAPADTSGNKNAIQALGSTLSYLERYTLFALTGLAAHGMDDDGQKSEPPEFITEEQVSEISKLIESACVSSGAFLKSIKVEQLSELPASEVDRVKKKLNSIIAAKAKQK